MRIPAARLPGEDGDGRGRNPLVGVLAALVAVTGVLLHSVPDPRRVVATDLFWLPTELPSLWRSKQLHLVRGPDDLARSRARRPPAAGAPAGGPGGQGDSP